MELVFVVYKDYDVEGYSSPIAVFSTEEKAETFVSVNRKGWYETWVIETMKIDEFLQ